VAAASKPSGTALLSEGDQRPTTNARTDASNMSGSSSPERCATTTGTITATERTRRGVLGTQAQT
jgi:hypothetical protein